MADTLRWFHQTTKLDGDILITVEHQEDDGNTISCQMLVYLLMEVQLESQAPNTTNQYSGKEKSHASEIRNINSSIWIVTSQDNVPKHMQLMVNICNWCLPQLAYTKHEPLFQWSISYRSDISCGHGYCLLKIFQVFKLK